MHRLWRKRGRRIRPNDKDLVFRTVFFLLFAVFAVAFVLLNIRTDWRSPSVAYLLFSAARGVKVCTVTAWLLNRPLASYIRSHMGMRGMAELMKIVVLTCDGSDFVSIIVSAASLRLTEPVTSQPTGKGS